MLGLTTTLIAGLFFLIGTLIAALIKQKEKLINFSIGISITVLIFLVIFDIFPECISLFQNKKILSIGGGILIGFGILMLVDKCLPNHSHYENIKKHHNHLMHIGIMTCVAVIIHNIIEGICIYGITESSFKMGISYAIAVGLHNIPFGINITASLNETKNVKKTIIVNILLAVSTLGGGVLVYLFNDSLNDFFLGTMLAVTIGMSIYLIFFELFNELKESFNKYSIYGIISGILLMLISFLI